MRSMTTALRLWLKLQSQAIHGCTKSLLVGAGESGAYQILAKWPVKTPDFTVLSALAKQVINSKKLQIQVQDQQLFVAKPLEFQGEFWGVVIVQLDTQDAKAARPCLAVLQAGMVWQQFLLHQFLTIKAAAGAPPARERELAAAAASYWLNFGQGLLREKSVRETAISLVNLLATQTKATRVSLGLVKGAQLEFEAVSFAANFDARTQAMQVLLNAAHEALDQAKDIVVPLLAADLASSQVTRCHELLMQQQQLVAVQTFLLRQDKQILGTLTFEFTQPPGDQQALLNFVQQSLSLAAPIIALQQSAARGSWSRWRNQLQQRLQQWFGEDALWGKLAAAAFVVFCGVLFVPAQYWIGSDATLTAASKYLLVAPQDGYLSAIKARPGDQVAKGQLLAQLNDEDLRLERRKLSSEATRYRQAYDNALANSNRVDAAIASAQADQAQIQLQLIEQQLARTQLMAPAEGVVVSKDISQALGAPVKQGEVLFEIAADGYWVELWIDEQDIAQVAQQQSGKLKLSSLPGEVFEFKVKSITPLSEVRNGRNYFQVEAELVKDAAVLRPGMTGSGKLAVGERRLGWIWFHQAWRWVRLTLWW